ncbi:MAG TPA: hypothetical protein VNM37_22970, partial [Candidatus Dormibacteraeota bacterium]|nr:hypothetical protein [Candidatus Dormibacteraeota bacterium]
MKRWLRVLLAIGALCVAGVGVAQAQPNAPKDIQAREMDLLRKTLAEQQNNPKQIIRTPQTLAFSTNSVVSASRLELERQYLDGKITAKQFQKSLEQLQEQERRQALAAARVSKPEPTVTKSSPAPPNAKPPSAPTSTAKPAAPGASTATLPSKAVPTAAAASAASAPTNNANQTSEAVSPEQKKLTEVESRIDEMMRLKAQRDKAATNAVGNAASKTPPGPLTKRQRLDALL